jgi:dipeptidyl aminopeptidase/acylaminoacyl peptidase
MQVMKRMLFLSVLLVTACTTTEPTPEKGPPTWAELHAQPTHLLRRGAAPHPFVDAPPPFGEAVTYPSGEMDHLAWYAAPEGEGPHPALLYVHRGFSLKQKDFALLQPYLDAGFAVFAPGFRAENGNPGWFELWKGELDDLVAAIHWLKARPEIDGARVHGFGHSAGGGLITLLTLMEEPHLATYASSNGIYTMATLGRWAKKTNEDLVRFPVSDMDERKARVLLENIPEMKHPLLAYTGDKDPWTLEHTAKALKSAEAHGKKIEQRVVPGKHGPSQVPALEDFLKVIRDE